MKIIKRAVSAFLAGTMLLGMAAVSCASGANSMADGMYLDGNNIVAEAGTSVTKTDNTWTVTETLTAEDTKMEFSLKAILPIAGEYILSIVSGQGAEVFLNGEKITLPTGVESDGLYAYTVRNAKFNVGTNEIKFSISGEAESEAAFVLESVTVTLPTNTVKGNEYSKTTNAWVDPKTEGDLAYWAYGGVTTPFYAEYNFYVPEDGEYSLSGVMSYPEGDNNCDTRYYSQCNITWDGFKNSTGVTSTPLNSSKFLATNVYTGIMLKKGIHTLRLIPTMATSSKKYNLYVGELTLTKTGEYTEIPKQLEIMGNEYSSLGGLTCAEKSDIILNATQETITDSQFTKKEMSAGQTETVTYSLNVSKAGYYSFEGWINGNSSQWVSANVIELDDEAITVNEDKSVTLNSKDENFHITKKTAPTMWLDEGQHKLEVIFSPRTNDNAMINGRIWKMIFTLISEDEIYIPAQSYVSSDINPQKTTVDGNTDWLKFRDDSRTEVCTVTYKFAPKVTEKYSFEAWATKADNKYVSKPVFKLNDAEIATVQGTAFDTYDSAHTAEGIVLTAGTEYTLTVEFQPKVSGGNINGNLYKMSFNRAAAKKDIIVDKTADNTLTGSFYTEPVKNETTGYVIYAQYNNGRLDEVVMEELILMPSEAFGAVSFGMKLPDDYASMSERKLFVLTDNLYPLFNAEALEWN